MGEVFAAHDPLLGREVAIKIGRSTEPLDQDRFLNEARHAARVVHPNLVAIFDVGVHRDAGFIAMELVHGTSLTQLVRRGPLDWMVVASIGVGVSAGLAALHDAALVHRDVKPGNLMLSTSGTMKVVDFGIAAAEGTPHLDAFEGSPGYIAPELILGEPPRRGADVFSLGVVLHELVMGARLFDGDTAAARALAVTQRTAPRLPAGRVPDWFAELVAACLLPDPHERPKHAGHVLAVLRAHEPFASLLAIGSGVTTSGELGREERTAFSLSSGPMVGRETICARLSERIARREGASISLHGRSGLGKTRMVSELAARCDLGTVLIVEEARGRAALAAALGLDSGREEAALRSALRELAPIFVALEDVPSGAVASDLSALVREEVPDALAVFTSGQAYEGVAFDETIGLEPLSPSEAEQLFAGRSRGGSGQLARAVAPLASGHPLSLELLARAIGPSDHDLGGVRGEDAMGSLVERSLRSVSIAARRCAERLALAGVRGAAFLGDAGTLAELARSGFLEQKEHGPALHAAIRESLLEALGRERRTEAVGREVLELLHREVMRLEAGAHGADAAEARRGLVHLRGEVVVAAQPVLADPSLDALGWVTQMLFSTLDWSLPTYDDAILVWSQLIGVLHRVGAEDEVLARAHLGRAWAHDSDLEASGRDVDEALIRARNGALRCELLAVRGSLLKRRGLSAEADAAFASLAQLAADEGLHDLSELAYWERAVIASRNGDRARGLAALAGGMEGQHLGARMAPRVRCLRVLLALEVGDHGRAVQEAEAALRIARALGQTRFVLIALVYLVEARVVLGDLELAENGIRQAILVSRGGGLYQPAGFVQQLYALVLLMHGDAHRALRCALDGRALVERVSRAPSLIARGLVIEAMCLALLGKTGVAERVTSALALMPGQPSANVRAVSLYARFALGAAGDLDALEELDRMLSESAPPEEWGSEAELAEKAVGAARGRLHVPRAVMDRGLAKKHAG